MKMIDPTYLRTIVDGLSSGALQKDNPAALPQGLIGVYEEAMSPESNVNDRQQFLAFFGMWAMLKKEASAELVADLLDSFNEAHVLDYISRYSKWFNAPSSGRYVLYHERLRTFVLQKLSEGDVLRINQRIINLSYKALENKQGDEWEHYALEHLSAHILLNAMLSKETGTELKKLAYDVQLWNRQIKLSKGFEWSKKMLNDMMLWALKYDGDEVIECALNKVDLDYLEQNDGANIVALVAQNDMEAALKRIETFSGNDKEGLQRKFTLYMLCLMELTLLEGRKSPHREKGIKQLLAHLDEQLPTDHSVLNWNHFFPSFLMFQMACEWAALGLNFMIPYLRTDHWEMDWITDKGPYSISQIQVLMECVRYMVREKGTEENDSIKPAVISTLLHISFELTQISKVEDSAAVIRESRAIARDLIDDHFKANTLMQISIELNKQGQMDASAAVIQESLTVARGLSDDHFKANALMEISIELNKQGQAEASTAVMQESLTIARGLSDEWKKSFALFKISIELSKQGQAEASSAVMQESLSIARGIRMEWKRCHALCEISIELSKQGRMDAAAFTLSESLASAHGIIDDLNKGYALSEISIELSKQGQVEEALAITRGISDDGFKAIALAGISIELSKQGRVEESLAIALGIRDDREKSYALKGISIELSKQGQAEASAGVMQKSLIIARGISLVSEKSIALCRISKELSKQGQMEASVAVIQESLAIARGIRDERKKNTVLSTISMELTKQGQVEKSLVIAQGIIDDEGAKSFTLSEISMELIKQGQVEESLAIARGISDERRKSITMSEISKELIKQGQKGPSEAVIQESLLIAQGMSESWDKGHALSKISLELCKRRQVEESLAIARGFSDNHFMASALMGLSIELSKQGQADESAAVMKESLTIVRGIIDDEGEKSFALSKISIELIKQGQAEKALAIAQGIGHEIRKCLTLRVISVELSKQGQMGMSLAIAQGISDSMEKSCAMREISIELRKQGQTEHSAAVMQESLTIARGISDESQRDRAMKDISLELSKLSHWDMAVEVGMKISRSDIQQGCWEAIGKAMFTLHGGQNGLEKLTLLPSEEMWKFYLKGWVGALSVAEASSACSPLAVWHLKDNMGSLEELLQKYALGQVVFGTPSPEWVERLNYSLNIQWLMDLKNQTHDE